MLTRIVIILPVLLVITLLPLRSIRTACAALGEAVDSVSTDAASLNAGSLLRETHAAHNAPSVQAYVVDRMALASGVSVNEYVGMDGRVFAVSWRGRRPPNLSILLGSFYEQYGDAAQANGLTAFGLHHALVQGTNVVVETSGHMRDMWGRAFLPAMLPPGVERSEIR